MENIEVYFLEKSQRNENEELRFSNYPELATLTEELDTIQTYMQEVISSISAFEEKRAEKIYLNIAELKKYLTLTYEVTDRLGRASNVCFDVLMNLRSFQEVLHELYYIHESEGRKFIDYEKPVTEEVEEVV